MNISGTTKLLLALLPLAFATPSMADTYPTSPINIIAPFPPGGGTDSMTRLVSNHLAQSTGWNVIAENRAGAGGTIGIASAARGTPNGYQLVMGQVDNLAVAPWLYSNLSYDSVKDFAPIVNVAGTSVVIVTRTDSPYKTLQDMIKPRKKSRAASTMARLAPAPSPTWRPCCCKSRPASPCSTFPTKVRPRPWPTCSAARSSKRSAITPDVPTVAELGYKDFDVTVWYGLLAPAGTPEAIVQKVNAEVNKILTTDEMKKAMGAQGAEPLGGTSAEFAETIARDRKKWGPIVEASGAKSK